MIALFVGRGWQHLYFDPPFRTLLWDESWMSGIIETIFNTSWEEFAKSPKADANIQSTVRGFGWFYLFLAALTIFIRKVPKWSHWLLVAGSISLIGLALLYMKNAFFSVGQFFEYSLQFLAPLFLLLFIHNRLSANRLALLMKIAIALTFTCHGLYAVGYYPRPVLFVQMTINVFGCSETMAHNFLDFVGYMDFIVSALIFLPGRIGRLALLYCVFWGLMTSVARIWGNYHPEFIAEILFAWTPEMLYRFPHFLVPLAAWLIYDTQVENH